MKQGNQVITQMSFSAAHQHQAAPEQPKLSIGEEAKQIIDKVFDYIKGAKPAWKYSFTEDGSEGQAKREWTKAFIENKVTQIEQVKAGLRKVRKDPSPYFPSCGQFISWCKPDPEDFGLPMSHTAYYEACRNAQVPSQAQWTHDAVFAAGQATGWYELRRRPEQEIYPVFKRNYEVACRKVMSGEELVIHKALPGRHKTLAEKNDEYHARELAKKVEKAGLSGLNGKDAISRMRDMLKGAA
ncbi:replication protein P [Spartinivicinus ruber]|uniref:replication protein P n=1 Tax=Spartinivicinus ruber TaxID=2683272 RepID=UPI0013D3B5B4|nr:replication protein P [Spartinivicinus ruber]